jgi:hypothetical protein
VLYLSTVFAKWEEGVGRQSSQELLAMVCMRHPLGYRGLAVTLKWPNLAARMKSHCYGFEAASKVGELELDHIISHSAFNP